LDKNEVPVVLGCGPIGLAVIAVLRHRGVGPIVAADFVASRREAAERLGADVVVDPAQASPFSSWYEIAAPAGFDPADPLVVLGLGPQLPDCVVFECVGRPGVIESILEGAPRNVRAVVLGVCMEPDSIEPLVAITKEAALRFVAAYQPDEFAETLTAIASGELDAAAMVTGKVGLGGVADAFERLARPEGHTKIVVEPWRD
ncbi:MAG: alcohol dehydrogenase, partial [Deltaproteobacteria bacterium]